MTHLYSPTIRISRFIHINRSCLPLIARLLQGCNLSKPIPFKVFLAFEAKKQPCTSLANNQSFSLKNALPFCYLLKWNKIGHFDNREGSTFRSINQAKIMVARDSQPKKERKEKKREKKIAHYVLQNAAKIHEANVAPSPSSLHKMYKTLPIGADTYLNWTFFIIHVKL